MYKELDSSIAELIDKIDIITNKILTVKSDYSDQAGDFAKLCIEIFPKIVVAYTEEPFHDYVEDVQYWTDLLKRIIDALQNADKYRIIDTLYFEAKKSLVEYRNLLISLELV